MKFDIDINKDYKEIVIVIKAPEMNQEVTDLMMKLKTQKSTTVSGLKDEKIFVLAPENILLLYTESKKVYADTLDSRYEIKKKLYEIETQLEGTSFIRISKSAIINIKKIKNIEVIFNGSLVVKFENGHEEIISRRYVKKVKDFIGLRGKKWKHI